MLVYLWLQSKKKNTGQPKKNNPYYKDNAYILWWKVTVVATIETLIELEWIGNTSWNELSDSLA